ncbi:MAG: chorismate mutase [Chitinophagaceae bacterium]|nr:MAG: chorismate mutase [Chitinophagaceae bacterium]
MGDVLQTILGGKAPSQELVAIQGFEGSFHQEAAEQFFGKDVPVLCCSHFRQLIKMATTNKEVKAAVMAIENSIAGSILPNYNLLHRSGLHIIGEVYLQINQQLLVYPGVAINDIREVHSHPMAILQCMDFLQKHDWKLVETEDTALSAKMLRQHRVKHTAAIAGKNAARLFNLDILAPNIQSEKKNYTRFLVLRREGEHAPAPHVDKASVSFSVENSMGSLAKVLTMISDAGVNLTKLQSFPRPAKTWQYYFHADMQFTSIDNFNILINNLSREAIELKVYGIYQSAI